MARKTRLTRTRTVGAVTLTTTTAAGRAVIEGIAAQARQAEEATQRVVKEQLALASRPSHQCHACKEWLRGEVACARCAQRSAQPDRWYLDAEGEWCWRDVEEV